MPSTSEPAVTTAATTSELTIASRASLVSHASSYQRVVNPSQGSEMIDESLNENRASINTGPNMTSAREGDHAHARDRGQAAADAGPERAAVDDRRLAGGRHSRRCRRSAHPAATSCQARS